MFVVYILFYDRIVVSAKVQRLLHIYTIIRNGLFGKKSVFVTVVKKIRIFAI